MGLVDDGGSSFSIVLIEACGEARSGEAGSRLDNKAVGNDVIRAAVQMTRMMSFAWFLGILKRMGCMMAIYLSILMATIV